MKAKGKPQTLNSQYSKNVAYYTEFAYDLLEKRSLACLTIQWEWRFLIGQNKKKGRHQIPE